jgi:PAT family beta-lactamase induction signal transducer AmpG
MKSSTVTAPMHSSPVKGRGLGRVIGALGRPRVLVMLLLGFSSGLPFLLTAGTFGYWLRDSGTSLKAIGFLSWVGFAYSFKYLWAPVIDRVDAPILGRWLGRRRGWMLLTQVVVAAGLLAMALMTPAAGLLTIGAAALVVAFAAATQDTVIDAWRIETAQTSEELGLLSSAYQLGYRVALLASDSLILIIANHLGWPISYGAMAALMGVGVTATFLAMESPQADAVLDAKSPLWTPRGFFDAVAGPFLAFFRTYGVLALLMLLFISLYRLPEYVMGPMATPFYHDLGLSKDVVGTVRGTVGLAASFAGIALGGLAMLRLGPIKGLVLGGILQALAIASFAILAVWGGDPRLFAAVMAFDNFGTSVAGVALVTYMSTLTSLGYTATQYALLSSTYTIVGKFLKGFSGQVVEGLQAQGHSLMQAYALFFVGCGLMGLPAILLLFPLGWASRIRSQSQAQPSAP